MSREIDAKVVECLGWTQVDVNQELIAGGHGVGISPPWRQNSLSGGLIKTPIFDYGQDPDCRQ
ncbi:hypothetical protein C2W64_04570 [Brevibacillus laterosporus]|nr:hypothetical protein [Brevibacillus laterosporus]RAP17749.1 hypothetical protein C2W64_04570 [Brevibacillus laterosporus]